MNISPIATLYSPYEDKFGVPRQPGLAPSVVSTIQFEGDCNRPEAVKGLEGFSHLWLIFGFHQVNQDQWSPTVRPPRLGGNQRVGVFASRSPFRPNGLGLSVVKLESVDIEHGQVSLRVTGADLVDGTPIFDIKPYIPFVDAIANAQGGFVSGPPPQLRVHFSDLAAQQLQDSSPELRQQLIEILAQDPRPAYQDDASRIHGIRFAGHNVRFQCDATTVTVVEIGT